MEDCQSDLFVENTIVDSVKVETIEEAKGLPSERDLQELRFNNLKSLLAKSSRYAELLLVKVKKDEEKQSHKRGRKRKDNEPCEIGSKKKRYNANDGCQQPMLSRAELETLAAGGPQTQDEKEDEHLQEFDEPKNFTGKLRDYQKRGMNWLLKLYLNGMNGILADEMGLGKTVQVIAHFCNLLENGVSGPFLVLAPLSTLGNWSREVERFAPGMNPVIYHGTVDVRKQLKCSLLAAGAEGLRNTIVITNYDTVIRDKKGLASFNWTYMVVDEGHRIKNMNCQLLRSLETFSCQNKLLLTGTPIQNNLEELWSLLHFLMPHIFSDIQSFHSWLDHNAFVKRQEDAANEGKKPDEVLSTISQVDEQENYVLSMVHQILSPFLMRRIKTEVELELPEKQELLVFCPMTEIQMKYYKTISERTILSILNQRNHVTDDIDYEKLWDDYGRDKRCYEGMTHSGVYAGSFQRKNQALDLKDELAEAFKSNKLTNFMVLMKRVVNHPFLIYNPHIMDLNWYEDYVTSSGKMHLLDKMLVKLKERGHKVLLFSQWTSILDIIEDALSDRNYKYCRIDGSVNLEKRQEQIQEFNREGSDLFLFLLTTRAGGQGINLTAADTVIIYDPDWNPQMDLQAQDRCHRIGQTKPVIVYRLVTENSIDQKILQTAHAKRKLEQVVLQKGRFNASQKSLKKKVLDVEELYEILKKQQSQQMRCREVTDAQIEQLLDRKAILQMKVGTCQGSNLNSDAGTIETKSAECTVNGDNQGSDEVGVKIESEFDDVTDMCGTNLPLFEIQGKAFDECND